MPDKIAGILTLLKGEETVSQLGRLHLTNLRLAYSITLQKGTETGVAMIRDIDSAVIRKIRSSLSLMVVGIILAIFGLMILSEFGRFGMGYGILLLLIGTIMIVVYFLLKEKSLQFTLNGKEWVSIPTNQLGSEEMIMDFVNTFFETKSKLDNVTKPINSSSLISF
ncbi:MAG: hypothetical protein QG588_1019 [Candidatus Poribacteria bacterium]|nr:hypothetical protein [Candidatus Poribacteria bacterium]